MKAIYNNKGDLKCIFCNKYFDDFSEENIEWVKKSGDKIIESCGRCPECSSLIMVNIDCVIVDSISNYKKQK